MNDGAGTPSPSDPHGTGAGKQRHAKEREESLRESEQRYRGLLSASNQVLYRHNADWSEMRQLSGGGFLADTESPDPDWFDKYIHPDDQPHVWSVIQEAIRDKKVFELEHRVVREDGTIGWTSSRSIPILDQEDDIVEWFGAASDVSARYEAEDGLREAAAKAAKLAAERSAILGQLAEGVVVTDADGRINFVNEAAKNLHGVETLDVEPSEYSDTYHLFREDGSPYPFEELPLARAVIKGETVLDAHWRIRRPDGTEVLAIGGAQPIRGADGKQIGSVLTVRDDTRRSTAEKALRENEAKLREKAAEFESLAENVSQLAWMAKPDGSIFWYNRRWYEYTGTDLESMKDWGWRDVHHPDHVDRVIEEVKAKWAAGQAWEGTYLLRSAQGEYRWFLTRAEPIRNDKGELVRWFGTNTDITEQLETEKALRDSQERFRTLLQTSTSVIWTAGPEGGFIEPQPSWRAFTGQPWPEHKGFGWAEMIHSDDRESLFTGWMKAVEQAVPYSGGARVWHAETGAYRHFSVHAAPMRNDDGAITGWVGSITDIELEKQAENALLDERNRLDTLNRTGAALSGELGLDRVVQMVTDAGVELTGAEFGAFFHNVLNEAGESYMLYTLSGADRSAFAGFPMPRNTAVFEPTFSGTGIVRSDDITQDPRYGKNKPRKGMPKGHLPVRSYLAVPVTSHGGEVIGGLFFGHSEPGRFTERHERLMVGVAAQAAVSMDNARLYKEVQGSNEMLEQRVAERSAELEIANEALRQAQKMEAIGQLTGGIAHDFNNMLTVIRGSADLLQRPALDDKKRQRYLEGIVETADRASRLTGQLLAFARRQALRPERFDALDCVESIAEMLHTVLGSGIELQIGAECPDCFVEADAAQFETALVNLAINARDAMGGEGLLMIELSRASELPPLVNQGSSGAFVAISVSDTGHGIAPENMDKIFEPFFTTKEVGKGTGLGLSQVYGFAKQSGGEIDVRSVPGEGTTFTLYLPEAEDDHSRAAGPGKVAAEPRPGGRVLVVEDNEEVGSFAEQALAELGFSVHLARSADEALALLDQNESFDVIFSDVVMPGKSGFEFAAEVQQRWPRLPLVLTSGYSHVLSGKPSHAFPLLQKPYSLEALQVALAQALHR